jgi:two-component sensor histidine kinase
MTVDSHPPLTREPAPRGTLLRSITGADPGLFLAPGLIVLVIVAAISAYLTLQSDETAALAHSATELRMLNLELNNKLADAETGQRGYLLTSDPSYLAPYEEAVAVIPQLSRKLADLTSGDPDRHLLATRVEELAQLKLGEIEQTLRLQRAGDNAGAIAVVRQDTGRKYFDGLRAVLAQLSEDAAAEVETRREQSEQQRRWLLGITTAGLVLSALLSILALSRARRQVGDLRERQRMLLDLNESLEERVAARTAELQQAKSEIERERDQIKALLADVNHRIGNNLQLVSSMLGFHSRFVGGEEARKALEAARNQVQSIASAQRRLRLLAGSDEVELDGFLEGLIQDMRETLSADRPVNVDLAVSPVRVESKTAINIAVIINELISNAVKHAFPNRMAGTVRVSVAGRGHDRVGEIIVEDDGVGLPPPQDGAGGLGGKIVEALSHSLNATMTVEPVDSGSARPGTRIRLVLEEFQPAT